MLGHVLLDHIEPHVLVAVEDYALDSPVGAVPFMSQDAFYVCCVFASGSMIFARNPEIEELEKSVLCLIR